MSKGGYRSGIKGRGRSMSGKEGVFYRWYGDEVRYSGWRRQAPSSASIMSVELGTNGVIKEQTVQKSDIAADMRLNLRDLRVVDPSFRSEAPVVLVRDTTIVIHIEHIRALVQANRVVLFDPAHPAVQSFIPILKERLTDVNYPLPYEFRALEAILVNVCSSLVRKAPNRLLSFLVSFLYMLLTVIISSLTSPPAKNNNN